MNTHVHAPVAPLPRARPGAMAAMIGSAACWGGATVMSRDLLAHFQAPSLLVIQLTASVVVLFLLAVPHAARRHISPTLGKASLAGILEPGLAYSIGLWGLSMTSAGSASIIGSSEPILIILMAWLFFGGVPSARLLACTGIAVAGLLLVAGGPAAADGKSSLQGDLLIVLATSFAAAYVVLSARWADKFPAAVLACSQQLAGLACAVAIYVAGRSLGLLDAPGNAVSWHLLLYAALSGVVQYALAFWLYLMGLRHLSAGAAGLWLTLIPAFGVSGAYLFLGEMPSGAMLAGMVLIIGAVYMGRREH